MRFLLVFSQCFVHFFFFAVYQWERTKCANCKLCAGSYACRAQRTGIADYEHWTRTNLIVLSILLSRVNFSVRFSSSCLLVIRPCRKCMQYIVCTVSELQSIGNYKIDCGVHLFENERRKDKNIAFRNRIKCNEQWHSCTIPFRDFLYNATTVVAATAAMVTNSQW